MFPRGSGYEVSPARLYLVKMNDNQVVKYIKGGFSFNERETYLDCHGLEQGTYFLFVEIDWDQ